MTLDQLTREMKVILFCMTRLERLKEQGLVEGGRYELTEEAKKMVEELEQDKDFSPSTEEIIHAMEALQND